MNISSPAFGHNQPIPLKFTCDGENISPPLFFADVPPDAKSLALIMDDPDVPGGTFAHWLFWNLPPDTRALEEAVGDDLLDGKAVSGMNGFNRQGYGGPCPPLGEEHRYSFRLYALDVVLDLAAGATHEALNHAMGGHVMTEGEHIGTYRRPGRPVQEQLEVPEELDIDAEGEAIDFAVDAPALTFPAPAQERFWVKTNKGTDPVATDQGDEQYEGKIYGTPDDNTAGFGNEGADEGKELPYIG